MGNGGSAARLPVSGDAGLQYAVPRVCATAAKEIRRGQHGAHGQARTDLAFLPSVKIVEAPPTLSDELLCTVLLDISDACGYSLPLLIVCDERYDSFVTRNKRDLESHFILRHAKDLLGEKT